MDSIKLNVNKSSVMWFARKRASSVVPPTILVDDHQLKDKVDKQKCLRIIFDIHLQLMCVVRCHTTY